jgi:hypothetical protein
MAAFELDVPFRVRLPLDAVIVLPGNQIPTKVFDVPESATVPAVLAEAPLSNLMPAPVLLVPPMLRLPPLPAVKLESPENWTPMPLELLPVNEPVPLPVLIAAAVKTTAFALPVAVAAADKLPPAVLMVLPVTEIAEPTRLRLPPFVLIAALTLILPAALSVRELPLLQRGVYRNVPKVAVSCG